MAKRALFGLLGCFFLLSAIGFSGDDGAPHVSVHCWDDAPVIIHPAPLQIQVLPFAPTDKFAKLVVRNTGSQPITAVILRTRHIDLNGHTLYGTDSSDFTSYGDPLNPGEQTQIEIGTAASANHALAELEISCEAALLEGGTVIGNDKNPAVIQIRATHNALNLERKRLLEFFAKGDMQSLEAELKKSVK